MRPFPSVSPHHRLFTRPMLLFVGILSKCSHLQQLSHQQGVNGEHFRSHTLIKLSFVLKRGLNCARNALILSSTNENRKVLSCEKLTDGETRRLFTDNE